MNQAKKLTHLDLNCSEDQFNNFLIDCWKLANNLQDGVRINVVVGKDEIVTFAFIRDNTEAIRLN